MADGRQRDPQPGPSSGNHSHVGLSIHPEPYQVALWGFLSEFAVDGR